MKEAIQNLLGKSGYRLQKVRPQTLYQQICLTDYPLLVLNAQLAGKVKFVQVGANDGQMQDPIYAWLTRYPWEGLLVEPQPNFAARLRALHADRPGITIDQTAVSDRRGAFELWYLDQAKANIPDWATGIASFKREAIDSHRHMIEDFDKCLSCTTVETITMQDLLDKHGIRQFDYLQTDTEGYDGKIVDGLDLARYLPPIISYEHAHMPFEEQEALKGKLEAAGYVFATFYGDTLACLESLLPVSRDRMSLKDIGLEIRASTAGR